MAAAIQINEQEQEQEQEQDQEQEQEQDSPPWTAAGPGSRWGASLSNASEGCGNFEI